MNGIGLLIYNEDNVEELVPAKTINSPQEPSSHSRIEQTFTTELHRLRLEVTELRRIVETLKRDVQLPSLKASHDHQSRRDMNMTTQETAKDMIHANIHDPTIREQPPAQLTVLPSFFSDNPWISVLTQRSREEKIAS